MLYSLLAIGALLCPLSRPVATMNTGAQATASEHIVHVYDIGSLTGHDGLKALEPTLSNPQAQQADLRKAFDEYLRIEENIPFEVTPESIAKNIERFMTPAPSPELRTLRLSGSQLAVLATPSEHAWIQRYLEAAGRKDILIDISVSLFSLEPGSFAALEIDPSTKGMSVESAEAMIAKISALDSSELVTAPRVTIHPGAKAVVSVGNQIAYVKDCEINLIGDPEQEVVTPVIEKILVGFSLTTRALPIGAETTAVRADITWSQLRGPLSKVERNFGESKAKVTIHTPDLVVATMETRFDIETDGAILVTGTDDGGSGPDAKPRELLAVISAQQLQAMPADWTPEEPEPGKSK